ncbi:MAG: [protein-PII] uridylyltransferase [Synoicihabitans sp.]
MSERVKKHTLARLNFTGDVPVSERTKACKAFLKLDLGMIKAGHAAGAPGHQTARALAAGLDIMLVKLFDYAIKQWEQAHGKLPAAVTLVALGGYGRSELSPHSDIDIMFLFPTKAKATLVKELQEHMSQEILYPLWDCGLKVGHSTRTVEEVFAEARAENQSKTALLEARRVAGSKSLFNTFHAAYRTYYTQDDPAGYIAVRLKDQAERRSKYGNTVFLQEPDIKNGVGGLRDYQNTLWMAQVKMDVASLHDLVEENYLRPNELKAFQRAYRFLLRVRAELHFQSKRPTDLLDLEAQPRIALGLGYSEPDMLRRVELFMRDYYRAAQTIYRSSKLVENRLALTLEAPADTKISFREVIRSRRYERTKRIDGFILRGSELSAASPRTFRDDPARLIRVFRHAQSLGAKIHFDLQALIREESALITTQVRESNDANTSFKAILQEIGAVHPALSKMHELGVLGRFIPEFDALTCLVQHEYYHRYTADIHTLNTIKQLDAIFLQGDDTNLKYRRSLHQTDVPALLYLILLLHDIGKAKGIRGHAESGVEIAVPLLQRLKIDEPKSEIVTFIIKNHLMMARFWQKRDVDDPATFEAFAELLPDADALRYLYVHTYCDACGTANGLWNSYKDTLHSKLYHGTLETLELGDKLAKRQAERLKKMHAQLLEEDFPGIARDEIEAHFSQLPDRYFLNTDRAEIELHLSMVNHLLKTITSTDSIGSLRPVVEWRNDMNRSLTIVHVVTWDRAGLFFKLAGAFNVAGLNILSSKVVSRRDHIAIDTFYVRAPGGGTVEDAKIREKFDEILEEALMRNADLLPQIQAQAEKQASARRYTRDSGRAEIVHATFAPRVDVYHELSMHRTIVEVQAPDSIGLLFRCAQAISEHQFDITFARIGTERHMAIDTFYIVDVSHAEVSEPDRLKKLQNALMEIVTPPEVEAEAG